MTDAEVDADMASSSPSLRGRAARGAAWSGASTIVLRLGGLVVGIVIARILTPEQFGVYAVALTVQGILMTVADLGLAADIVRSDEPEKIAPTVATLGLVSGTALTALTMLGSGYLATALGSPDAAPAIAMLSVTLLLGGAGVVPYAFLTRRFEQRQLFVVGAVDFVVSTVVTLVLIGLGFGVMGLAIGRVAAQTVALGMQFLLARVKPHYSIDRTVLRPVLTFGLPIAAANLLSWGLLNVDNIVLARVAGAVALGYYVLAFNISSWPMSALSQMVRSVALPYFSRAGADTKALSTVTSLAWAVALPAGAVLAVLSGPVIEVVYGSKWLPAATVLSALGLYGSLRVVFDIFTGYLYARGNSRSVLWIQIIWLVTLTGGLIVAVMLYGIIGAGWVHVFVAVAIILPAYLLVVKRSGVRIGELLRATCRPTLATIPVVGAVIVIRLALDDALLALLVGGAVALLLYMALVWPWARRVFRQVREGASDPAVGSKG